MEIQLRGNRDQQSHDTVFGLSPYQTSVSVVFGKPLVAVADTAVEAARGSGIKIADVQLSYIECTESTP